MGLDNSVQMKDNYAKDYSQEEILNNINNMFAEKKYGSVLTDGAVTGTLNFNNQNHDPFYDENENNIAFIQQAGRKNRYEKYDLGMYVSNLVAKQSGGNPQEVKNETSDEYKQLEDFDDFHKIRDHVLNDINKQTGGSNKLFNLNINNLSNSPATPMDKPFNILSLMNGGKSHKYSDSDSDDEIIDIKKKITNKKGQELRPDEADSDTSDVNPEDVNSEEDEIDEEDAADNDIDDDVKEDIEEVKTDSDGGINPFYSNDSASDYEFQHPYVKRKFN